MGMFPTFQTRYERVRQRPMRMMVIRRNWCDNLFLLVLREEIEWEENVDIYNRGNESLYFELRESYEDRYFYFPVPVSF